ncbi:MAG: 50S ribosomal protein L16 [Spirochaetales bacterium]|nr:50S ribosomal protein L16 [Spirochaetales bacterium]
MLAPKRMKFRKKQRGHFRGVATTCNTIAFGEFALASTETLWVNARQIEAARIAMTRHIKRGGKVWIRVFPDMPYTKKPAETRMGKGKGNVEGWVTLVKPGTVMFEMAGVSLELATEAMALAGAKLPINTKFIQRRELGQS